MESRNKGPHFWDEDHTFRWYTDIFDPVAQAVERGEATAEAPLSIDASSNTFTVSGVNVRGKRSHNVREQLATVLLLVATFAACSLPYVLARTTCDQCRSSWRR